MKMRIAVLAGLLAAANATAGVRIETVQRDVKTKAPSGEVQTVLVQSGNVRVAGRSDGYMLLKGATLYVVDEKRKSYREIDKEKMKAMAGQGNAAMSQMQERLAKMPPEQRAQFERMMGGMMPGGAAPAGKPDVYTSKDLARSEVVEGRTCRMWHVLKNGKPLEELCVVPFSSLPGKEDFQTTFKHLAEAFEGLAGAVPGAADEAKARSAINGYPVRVRRIEGGVPAATETILRSWKEESLPASLFEIPAGYKKREDRTPFG